MQTIVLDEYRVSQRVVLRPGDKFRVAGGPYYRLADGTKVPLAVRGVCRFVRCLQRGSCVTLEAWTPDGFAVLHMAGRRRRVSPGVVCRPYKVKGKVRG